MAILESWNYELCSLTIDKNKVMDREVGNFVETQDSRSLRGMSIHALNGPIL
jgi:hypothetical protein